MKQNSLATPKTPSPQRSAVRQPQQEVRAAALAARRQVRDAARPRQRLRDLLRGAMSDFNEARATLEGPLIISAAAARPSARMRGFFLVPLWPQYKLTLGLLLGDLFLLDGAAGLLAEDQMRDRDII